MLFDLHCLSSLAAELQCPAPRTDDLPEIRALLTIGSLSSKPDSNKIKRERDRSISQRSSFVHLCNLSLLLSLLPVPKAAKPAWKLQLSHDYDRQRKPPLYLQRHEAFLQTQEEDITQHIPHQQLSAFS